MCQCFLEPGRITYEVRRHFGEVAAFDGQVSSRGLGQDQSAGIPRRALRLEQPAFAVGDQLAGQAHQHLFWRVRQLEKELFGPSSERQTPEMLSKEQILLSLFPAATQEVLLPPVAEKTVPRERRQRPPKCWRR